jgi:hypothetical protein
VSLWTNVVARYSNNLLVALTNPDSPTTKTITTARADEACLDAIAMMLSVAQVEYDDDDQEHVRLGTAGVIAFLKQYGAAGSKQAEAAMEKYRLDLMTFASKPTRPKTSQEAQAASRDFDEGRFDAINVQNPSKERGARQSRDVWGEVGG